MRYQREKDEFKHKISRIKYIIKEELINEFSKVVRDKVNTRKSVSFLYTNSEQSEKEIKKTISFTIASRK